MSRAPGPHVPHPMEAGELKVVPAAPGTLSRVSLDTLHVLGEGLSRSGGGE